MEECCEEANKENASVNGQRRPIEAATAAEQSHNEYQQQQQQQQHLASAASLSGLSTRRAGKRVCIELIKGAQGLGFKLASRDNYTHHDGLTPIYVKSVLPRGAAIDDGRLQRGDRLVAVNGADVTRMNLHECVALLRNTRLGTCVSLVVVRQVQTTATTTTATTAMTSSACLANGEHLHTENDLNQYEEQQQENKGVERHIADDDDGDDEGGGGGGVYLKQRKNTYIATSKIDVCENELLKRLQVVFKYKKNTSSTYSTRFTNLIEHIQISRFR